MDVLERLSPAQAKAAIRRVLEFGVLTYSKPHALERMAQRRITALDVVNVLRGGTVKEPELVKESWRYQVQTNVITVVTLFLGELELLIVTAWRNGR